MRRYSLPVAAAALACSWSAGAVAAPADAHHGRGTAGIFWFLHLSDSHIGASSLIYPNATEHFETALNEAVAVIGPTFVVVTGDLCDGSANNIPTSGQEQAEWDAYRQVVDQAAMTTNFYFDLPGNHDGYADIGMTYYLANSLQGQANGTLFADWTVTTPVGEHYFFGLNSAGDGSGPGFEDPEFTSDEIAALDAGLQAHGDADLVFALGHHQPSLPANGGQVVSLLSAAGGAYYLHGHRHGYSEYLEGANTVVVNEIDTLGKGNVNNVGVGVVDHNAFVYRAQDVVSPWPFVMITAPVSRNVRGSDTPHPYAYDVCLDRTDNPFRAVVFSPTLPTDVTVEVSPTVPPTAMSLVAGTVSLWEAEVDTTALAPGPHDVTVTAWVDGDVAQHTVNSAFVPGPCEGLPDDGDLPVGGAGGAGGSGAIGGAGGWPGQGGDGGALLGGLGGTPPSEMPPIDDAGGCGCRLIERHDGRHRVALLGLFVGALGLRRRRRRSVR